MTLPPTVDHRYENTEPKDLGEEEKHDFDNPLYDTSNDYSSPWDTRTAGSNKLLVVTSPISTHAVVMRVNSNEPGVNGSRKSSAKNEPVQYAEVDTSVKAPRYENTKLRPTTMDYAEPFDTPPQPVYDSADDPQTVATPTHHEEIANLKVGPYEYTVLPGHGSSDKDERTFDNKGEHGVYQSYI